MADWCLQGVCASNIDLFRVSEELRSVAADIANSQGVLLVDAYVTRIRSVEQRSMLRHCPIGGLGVGLCGAEALATARTWHDLQVGQVLHDRQFHPDVFGLSKTAQMQHYSFHVAKLAGLFAGTVENDDWESFLETRLADIAVFGVKIATACGVELPHELVDQSPALYGPPMTGSGSAGY